MTELRKYLDAERGRAIELARQLEVTPGAITQWADDQVPAMRVLKVSALTGIPVEVLRPDMMPKQEGNAA
jgi:DNA-binding transcriptional regulator YdaS (Cro superfamily)